MKNILIIYHSGSGGTKKISEFIKEKLYNFFNVDISEVKSDFNYCSLSNYDLLIFGFPTYFCKPPRSVIEFIDNMPKLKKSQRAFVFNTCGFLSVNTLRIFMRMVLNKNIYPLGSMTIKAPVSDHIMLPFVLDYFFQYENNLLKKIDKFIFEIKQSFDTDKIKTNIPNYKIYTPLVNLIMFGGKIIFNLFKKNIKILKTRCTNCNQCVENCDRNCWESQSDFPKFNSKNCELCLKCIHNCPQKAIIFSRFMQNKKRFNKKFWDEIKLN